MNQNPSNFKELEHLMRQATLLQSMLKIKVLPITIKVIVLGMNRSLDLKYLQLQIMLNYLKGFVHYFFIGMTLRKHPF